MPCLCLGFYLLHALFVFLPAACFVCVCVPTCCMLCLCSYLLHVLFVFVFLPAACLVCVCVPTCCMPCLCLCSYLLHALFVLVFLPAACFVCVYVPTCCMLCLCLCSLSARNSNIYCSCSSEFTLILSLLTSCSSVFNRSSKSKKNTCHQASRCWGCCARITRYLRGSTVVTNLVLYPPPPIYSSTSTSWRRRGLKKVPRSHLD